MQLDEEKRSPADLLHSLPESSRPQAKGLLQALQGSLNPSAPPGYVKPDAFHGSPWALEILTSGALKGGVNDAKGGRESLEGMVFFSDRTGEHDGDMTTRVNLRQKPRTYADGKGIKPSSASNRGLQYRMIQALQASWADGKPLQLTRKAVSLEVGAVSQADAAIKETLQSVLTDNRFQLPKLAEMTLDEISMKLTLPEKIVVSVQGSSETLQLAGQQLHDLYVRLLDELKLDLESGKAPFLTLINNGSIVPVVFGFDKISGLKQHAISGSGAKPPKLYSYQSASHPLSGSERGGKLQEIEVRSLQDLATLLVACESKGCELPPDIVVRINPPTRVKKAKGLRAQYLTPDQVGHFKSQMARKVAEFMQTDDGGGRRALRDASIPRLQDINTHIRSVASEEWVPERLQREGDAQSG